MHYTQGNKFKFELTPEQAAPNPSSAPPTSSPPPRPPTTPPHLLPLAPRTTPPPPRRHLTARSRRHLSEQVAELLNAFKAHDSEKRGK
jgi:hypothetical protein